jgi:hypothetical protein
VPFIFYDKLHIQLSRYQVLLYLYGLKIVLIIKRRALSLIDRRPRRRLNTEIDLKDTECADVYWSHLAQDRDQCLAVMNSVMSLWVSQKTYDVLVSWAAVNFSRRTVFFEEI